MKVVIGQQLRPVIEPFTAIQFIFSEISGGQSQTLDQAASTQNVLPSVIGSEAPQMRVSKFQLSEIDSSGAGKFRIELECLVPMVGNLCGAQDIQEFYAYLVPTGGLQTPDRAQLDDMILNRTTAESEFMPHLTIAPSTGFNGGLVVANNPITEVMLGPETLAANQEMFLILTAGQGYTYIKLDAGITL